MTAKPSAADVLAHVAAHFDVLPSAIRGPHRAAAIVRIRHIGMYLARRFASDSSYPCIARAFGRGDHTTAMAAVRSISRKLAIARNVELVAIVATLSEDLSTFAPPDASRKLAHWQQRLALAEAAVRRAESTLSRAKAMRGTAALRVAALSGGA